MIHHILPIFFIKVFKKIFVGFLGCLFVLAFFEIIFTALSCFQKTKDEFGFIRDKKIKVILCIGNSFTFGSGAPQGESYPDHLQRLFDAEYGKGVFKVINKGIPTYNSSMVLNELDAWLYKYAPALTLVQVGEPNWWNWTGYSDYLERKLQSPKKTREYLSFLYHFRTTYFISYLLSRVIIKKNKLYNPRSPWEGDWLFVSESKDQIIANTIRDIARRLYEGGEEKKDLSPLIATLDNLIWKKPDAFQLYYWRAVLKLKNKKTMYKAAIDDYIKSFLLEPFYFQTYFSKELIALFNEYKDEGDIIKSKKLFLTKMKVLMPSPSITLENSKNGQMPEVEIRSWFSSDLETIIQHISRSKSEYIIQNYPPDPDGEREVDSLIRETAKNKGYLFIDQNLFFKSLLEKGIKKSELHRVVFGKFDPHPNGRGYRYIAEDIYQNLKHFSVEKKISLFNF